MLRTTVARAAVMGVVLLFVALGARPASAAANLLANPDFEQPLAGHPWMPAGWDTSEAGLSSVFFGRDTFLVERGRYAVSLANVSTLYPLSHNWNQAVSVILEALRPLGSDYCGQQASGYANRERNAIDAPARISWRVRRRRKKDNF